MFEYQTGGATSCKVVGYAEVVGLQHLVLDEIDDAHDELEVALYAATS